MCQSMVNIQSPTAEIRRGKTRRKKQDENIIILRLCKRLPLCLHDIVLVSFDTRSNDLVSL